jgi:hypothetical protein
VTKRARLVQSDVDRPERSTSIGQWFAHLVPGRVLERMTGIEPALSAWEDSRGRERTSVCAAQLPVGHLWRPLGGRVWGPWRARCRLLTTCARALIRLLEAGISIRGTDLERLREDPATAARQSYGDALESARPGVRHPPDQRRDRRPMRPGYPP